VRIVEGAGDLFDLEETALVLPEIDGVAALEIDLDEDETLVVLAENRLQEPASAEDLLQDQVVRRRQVVEVVLGGRDLGRASDLVAHFVCLSVAPFFSFLCGCVPSSNCLRRGRCRWFSAFRLPLASHRWIPKRI
jgi:hypothetical protein